MKKIQFLSSGFQDCSNLNRYFKGYIQTINNMLIQADSRFVSSQWETSLQSNAASHWLNASLESALWFVSYPSTYLIGPWEIAMKFYYQFST